MKVIWMRHRHRHHRRRQARTRPRHSRYCNDHYRCQDHHRHGQRMRMKDRR